MTTEWQNQELDWGTLTQQMHAINHSIMLLPWHMI